jgi:hypothetical protein
MKDTMIAPLVAISLKYAGRIFRYGLRVDSRGVDEAYDSLILAPDRDTVFSDRDWV